MTASLTAAFDKKTRSGAGLVVALLVGLTVIRLIGLKLSVVDLFVDEAQYWAWSRHLALGYFSKPPLLAWIIAAAEHVCGSSEACVRSPSPIMYLATSLLIYAAACSLYDRRTAVWAALFCALMPGAVFSARIISTDVPLLLFWALALFAYVKLIADPRPRWGVLLGIALGLGLLAKYAMIYFLFGVALAAVLDSGARALLRTRALWLGVIVAVVLILPNVVWNLSHGLVTFRSVGDNVHNSGSGFDPRHLPEFLLSQFGVSGPITFAVLLLAIARMRSSAIPRADRLMLAFAIPPLALIAATSLITHVNANWAATSFISGIIVAVAIMERNGARALLVISLAIGVVAQVALIVGDAVATQAGLPQGWGGDVYHRVLGWRALGETAGRLAQKTGAGTIVGENRDVVAALLYYWRDQPQQVLQWRVGGPPQFELAAEMTAAAAEPVLLITACPSPERLKLYYANVAPLGRIDTPTGPTSQRSYVAFALSGRRGPLGPLAPCTGGNVPERLSQPVDLH